MSHIYTDQEEISITVLGEKWLIIFKDEDDAFEDSYGFTDLDTHTIVIETIDDIDCTANQQRVIRHEIVHAFLMESGLAESSNAADSWATNEEMVDWFARMSPKIFKVYQELDIL